MKYKYMIINMNIQTTFTHDILTLVIPEVRERDFELCEL